MKRLLLLLAALVALPGTAHAQTALGSYGRLRLQAAHNVPPAGYINLWCKTADGTCYQTTSSGTDTALSGGGGGGTVTADAPLAGNGSSGSHLTCATCMTASPTTTGDIFYSTSGGVAMTRIAAVSAGSYLRSNGTSAAPLWSTLKIPNAASSGDLLYASSSNTIAGLTIGSANTALISNGSAPSWGTIANAALTNSFVTVSTTAPLGGGGAVSLGGSLTLTCSTCLTASPTTTGDLFYSTSGTVALSRLAAGGAGTFLRFAGAGSAPVVSTLVLPNAATTGDILTATSTNTVGVVAAVAAGSVLASAGTGTAPAYRADYGAANSLSFSPADYSKALAPALQASSLTMSHRWVFTRATTQTGVYFWYPGPTSYTIKCSLWESATRRATGTVAVSTAGFYTCTYGTPYSLAANVVVGVSVWENTGTSFWNTSGVAIPAANSPAGPSVLLSESGIIYASGDAAPTTSAAGYIMGAQPAFTVP